jgi:hypothetical protein
MKPQTPPTDKSTQIDLLYGLKPADQVDGVEGEGGGGLLLASTGEIHLDDEHLPIILPVDNDELNDPIILKNAATRADGSLAALADEPKGGVRARRERWRYLDGIAPPAPVEAKKSPPSPTSAPKADEVPAAPPAAPPIVRPPVAAAPVDVGPEAAPERPGGLAGIWQWLWHSSRSCAQRRTRPRAGADYPRPADPHGFRPPARRAHHA